jgi:tetratricopeptide (TPR) repeat protein
MQSSRRIELITIPFLAILFIAIPAPAQDQPPAQTVDPLTGQVTSASPEEVVEPSPRADLTEATAMVAEEDYTGAEALLAGLQQEFPDDPALLLLRGELLLALARPDEACTVLEHGATVDPQRPRIHFQLGTALASTGRRKEALAAFGKELELNEDEAVRTLAHLNRSLLFEKERNWSSAVRELEAVLEIQPSRTEIYGDLVTLYIQSGQTAEAIEVMERGAGAGFASSRHYYSLGARLYRDERYEEAVAMLTKAVELEPGLHQAERSLAAALEKLGRDAEALEHLRRYLELHPDAPDAAAVSAKIKSSENP